MAILGRDIATAFNGTWAVDQFEVVGPFTMPANGTLTAIGIRGNRNSAATRLTLGIYADSGGSPVGSPLVTSSEIAPIAGPPVDRQHEVAASYSLVAGQSYWIGSNVGGDTFSPCSEAIGSNPPESRYNVAQTYSAGVLPAIPALTGLGTAAIRSLYLVYTPTAGSNSGDAAFVLPVPVFSAAGSVAPPGGGLVDDAGGTVDFYLPLPAFSASGTVEAPGAVLTGAAAFALPLPSFSAVGGIALNRSGSGAFSLPLPVFAAGGTIATPSPIVVLTSTEELLIQAEAAYGRLMMGLQTVSVQYGDKQITYTAASQAKLWQYIEYLKNKLLAEGGSVPGYTKRRSFTVDL